MREHGTEYVVNMWKVYNHLHLGGRNSAQLLNLLAYCAYIYLLCYLLAHLPPPAAMLRHSAAVSDLLLGEEFDEQDNDEQRGGIQPQATCQVSVHTEHTGVGSHRAHHQLAAQRERT